MGSFISNYWASILAAITVTGGPALLYTFRDTLIQGFWELSEQHIQDVIPTEVRTKTETKVDEVVEHEREEFDLELDGSREINYTPSRMHKSVELHLVDVDGDYVELKEISLGRSLYPYSGAESVKDKSDTFRLEANRNRNLRGKLIMFSDGGLGACTTLVHAENVSERKSRATVVVESFSGRIKGDYEHGLG